MTVMHARNHVRLQRLAALAIGISSWLQGSDRAQPGPAVASAQSNPARSGGAKAKPKAKGKGGSTHVSPVVEACVEHHTDAQELRMAGKLLESRLALRQCAAEACPALLQRDCVGWLDQIEPQIPSLTFRVTVDGMSRTDAQVFIDDAPTSEPSVGKAVDLDPGPHRVRVVVAGLAPFEDRVMLSEGERYRMVQVALTSPPRPPPEMHRPVPLATYVLGGVAIAGAVSGAFWSASSISGRNELEETCAPTCSQSRVDDLRRRAMLADVSWGVSVLSLAGATAFFLLRPELPVDVDVALSSHGGVGLVRLQAF
jgi:hypothetical protein